jgi:hypothetical protein
MEARCGLGHKSAWRSVGSLARLKSTPADRPLRAKWTAKVQAQYGELIYGYPMRSTGASGRGGGFYVFAFERGRIFRRVRTYEGRAPFRAYLLGFVLDDLVLEWKRGVREIETVSIETR